MGNYITGGIVCAILLGMGLVGQIDWEFIDWVLIGLTRQIYFGWDWVGEFIADRIGWANLLGMGLGGKKEWD